MKINLLLLDVTIVMLSISCKEESKVNPGKPIEILDGWTIYKKAIDFEINIRDMYFVNSRVGFVVGFNGAIYATTNGGNNWAKQNSNTTLHLLSVHFIDEKTGYISGLAMSGCLDEDCGKGAIFLKTNDGGKNWEKSFFSTYTRITSLHFFDANQGLAIISIPDVLNQKTVYLAKTIDGGQNWQLTDVDIFQAGAFYSSIGDVTYVNGENQKIFKSTDRGDNWITLETPVPANYDVCNMYFIDTEKGFIDGKSQIYQTTNGGLTWYTTNFPFTSMETFHTYDEYEVFNVIEVMEYEGGDFPTFKGSIAYQTFDGGLTWSQSELNDSVALGLTCFPMKDIGYSMNFSEFYTFKRNE
jgi:photosystem II stability/assembly factor-like uncharacterized protein